MKTYIVSALPLTLLAAGIALLAADPAAPPPPAQEKKATVHYINGPREDAAIPRPGMNLIKGQVAVVITDPQNDFLSPKGVAWGVVGTRQVETISPDNWLVDQSQLDRPGNKEIQMALFGSYASNPPLYPKWQEYFRKHQPPTLIVWGKNDIIFRVNIISPGPVMTPIFGKMGMDQETQNQVAAGLLQGIPLQRFGTSGEIASCVAFLASDAAAFITGQELVADGGMSQF